MDKHTLKLCILAAAVCLLAASNAFAGTLGITPITDTAGNPPGVERAELQQDALRYWSGSGAKARPLIVFSDMLGLFRPYEQAEIDRAVKDLKAGKWDKVLARPYPEAAPAPVNYANYIYYLHRLGIVSEVYWVPPVRGPVGGEPIESFKEYLKSLGASEEELAGLTQEDYYIRGRVNGVPVHVTGLGDFVPPPTDSLLLVDAKFINMLYRDEVTEPMLDLFADFATALSGASPKVSHAVVVDNNAFGEVPLERRFLGGYLFTLLADPASIKDSPPASWLMRSQIMYYDTFFQVEESLELCRQAAESAPDDPAAIYELALGYFGMKDMDGLIEYLDRAVVLDKGYYLGYIQYADYFTDKGLAGAAEHLLESAYAVQPRDPRVLESFHKLHVSMENYSSAIEVQKKIIDLGFDGVGDRVILADDYKKAGEFKESIEAYKSALSLLPVMGNLLRPGVLIGLAEAYEGAKMLKEATDTYELAMASAPDDISRQMVRARYDKFLNDWRPFMEKQGG